MITAIGSILPCRQHAIFPRSLPTASKSISATRARGTILSLKEVGYEIFNLGSDQPYAINDMLAILSQQLELDPIVQRRPAHPADVPQTWADIEKAKRLLGWQIHHAPFNYEAELYYHTWQSNQKVQEF